MSSLNLALKTTKSNPILDHSLDTCTDFFSRVFNEDYVINTYFIHIAASKKVINDVA